MAQPEHRRADAPVPEHLDVRAFIDADYPSVRAFAERAVRRRAGRPGADLAPFTVVRDEIRYDPYEPPLTFDGSADALLHPFAADGSAYMECIRDRGAYADLPWG